MMKRRTLLKWSTPLVASAVLPVHAQTSETMALARIVQSVYVFCSTPANPNYRVIPEVILSPAIANATVEYDYTIEDMSGGVLINNSVTGLTDANGTATFPEHVIPEAQAGNFVFTNVVTLPSGEVIRRAETFTVPFIGDCV